MEFRMIHDEKNSGYFYERLYKFNDDWTHIEKWIKIKETENTTPEGSMDSLYIYIDKLKSELLNPNMSIMESHGVYWDES